ncbi:MAG: hypothetical protein R3286_12935 [Gammaproteobacteria bacterium]|nr:hypothetical protein [Gammaproteobacteria bacterium]
MSRQARAPRVSSTETHPVVASDGAELRLTRWRGGGKGPVVLAPGFGTSILAFTVTTVDTNLPEFLCEAGYDVWLLDYRSSPSLPVSATQYTLDDVVAKDWPAAIARVRELTGAGDVQAVAHCVGSATLLVSLMTGLEGVRSVVASQFTPHVDFSSKTQLKAGTHMPSVLNVLGVEGLDPDCKESNWETSVSDCVLSHYPTWEKCGLNTCHRILFLYGEVFKHAMLNEATHQVVHEMFGNATMSAFVHLSRIILARRMVDSRGGDVYLPLLGELKVPVAFLHGADNRFIMPSGSERTFEQLKKLNPDVPYTRTVIPGYAHMDCFIGQDAHRDVFPTIRVELDKYN